jgi:uncharacterized protein involved in exopolysaccharide biosynthesis
VTAPQYFHSNFRLLFSKRRRWLALACLVVVGIGAAIMAPPSAFKSDAAIASRDPVSRAETIPTASSGAVGYAAVDPRPASGASDIVQKPFCVSPGRSDGSCVSFELPKVRVVRVPRVTGGQQDNSAKSGLAAAPRSSGSDKETSEPIKTQRSALRQNQRRVEARVADWRARGYARDDHGRPGFSRSFW